MELSYEIILLLIAIAMLGGFIDSVSGGGGLIVLPSLLLFGLGPVEAIATNKFQALFGKISAVRYFARQGMINFGQLKLAIILATIAGFFGALLTQSINSSQLALIVPGLIGCALVYLVFSPQLGSMEVKAKLSIAAYSLGIVPLIAFYDGFFGPASSSFFVLSLVGLLGFNIVKATAHAKLLLLVTNFAAVVSFVLGGHILWLLGLCMAVGQWIGSHYGSKAVHLKGNKIVRPMLITVCIVMLMRIFYQQFYN